MYHTEIPNASNTGSQWQTIIILRGKITPTMAFRMKGWGERGTSAWNSCGFNENSTMKCDVFCIYSVRVQYNVQYDIGKI